MAKLKPIERFGNDVRRGDLVRVVCTHGDLDKAGYLADIEYFQEESIVHLNCIPLSKRSRCNVSFKYFHNSENTHIEGYEVLRRVLIP